MGAATAKDLWRLEPAAKREISKAAGQSGHLDGRTGFDGVDSVPDQRRTAAGGPHWRTCTGKPQIPFGLERDETTRDFQRRAGFRLAHR